MNKRPRRFRWTRLLSAVIVVGVIAWLLGRIASDRYGWSQWLLWIPTPTVLLAIAVGTAMQRKNTRIPWAISLVAIGVYFSVIEHRLHRFGPPGNQTGVRIGHWTVSHNTTTSDFPAHVDAVLQLDPDIAVLTHAGEFLRDPRLQSHFGLMGPPPRLQYFTLLSRFPVIEFRELIAVDKHFVAMAELDTTETLGRPIVVYIVDLPSDPKEPRMTMARRLRRLLDSIDAPPPDVMLGDFNLTRGGSALAEVAGTMRHAYNLAGHGYGATYHRRFPLIHIDHIFVSDALQVRDYTLHDPGIGRHRSQVAEITRPSQ